MKICSSCVIPETAETLYLIIKVALFVVRLNTKMNKLTGIKDNNYDEIIKNHRNTEGYDCIVPFLGERLDFHICGIW